MKTDRSPIRRRLDTIRAWSAIQAHMRRQQAEVDRYASMTQYMARTLAEAVALLKQYGTIEEMVRRHDNRIGNLEHLNQIRD